MADRAGVALPVLALLVNAFVWGVSWWPFRQLQSFGVHPLWATALIYIVSLGVLTVVRPRAWRGLATTPRLWVLLLASGMTNVGFNWAVTIGDVVRVVLLFYLMPAWTVLLAWWMLHIRPTPMAFARLALALAGVVVILKAPGSEWPVPEGIADWLALVGGFSFALTNIVLRQLADVAPAPRIFSMFAGGAVLATAAAALGMAAGNVPALPAPQWAWAGVGIALSLGFLASNMALQYGAPRLHAHVTSLVMLAEIVFASVSSILLGAAELTGRTLAGGALILGAAAWAALAHNGSDQEAP